MLAGPRLRGDRRRSASPAISAVDVCPVENCTSPWSGSPPGTVDPRTGRGGSGGTTRTGRTHPEQTPRRRRRRSEGRSSARFGPPRGGPGDGRAPGCPGRCPGCPGRCPWCAPAPAGSAPVGASPSMPPEGRPAAGRSGPAPRGRAPRSEDPRPMAPGVTAASPIRTPGPPRPARAVRPAPQGPAPPALPPPRTGVLFLRRRTPPQPPGARRARRAGWRPVPHPARHPLYSPPPPHPTHPHPPFSARAPGAPACAARPVAHNFHFLPNRIRPAPRAGRCAGGRHGRPAPTCPEGSPASGTGRISRRCPLGASRGPAAPPPRAGVILASQILGPPQGLFRGRPAPGPAHAPPAPLRGPRRRRPPFRLPPPTHSSPQSQLSPPDYSGSRRAISPPSRGVGRRAHIQTSAPRRAIPAAPGPDHASPAHR